MWMLRKRTPNQLVVGGNTRIRIGIMGPRHFPIVDFDPQGSHSIYDYHQGELFTPGVPSLVFEPEFELPLQTIWGRGCVRQENVFNPIHGGVLQVAPGVQLNGLPVQTQYAGSLALQPLFTGQTG